jgi:hypothetical protein
VALLPRRHDVTTFLEHGSSCGPLWASEKGGLRRPLFAFYLYFIKLGRFTRQVSEIFISFRMSDLGWFLVLVGVDSYSEIFASGNVSAPPIYKPKEFRFLSSLNAGIASMER